MTRFLPFVIVLLAAAALVALPAFAGSPAYMDAQAQYCSAMSAWHSGYYHPAWGMPVALVVSPKAEFQTRWGWGVGNTRVTTTWHQFHRNYPGRGDYDPRTLQPTPYWPSDTDQFGVYYVRGPW